MRPGCTFLEWYVEGQAGDLGAGAHWVAALAEGCSGKRTCFDVAPLTHTR